MYESYFFCVKTLSFYALIGFSVHVIAKYGVTLIGAVYSYLVRPACFKPESDK